MISRFHVIYPYKKYSTIPVLDRKGEKTAFRPEHIDLKGYRDNRGPKDAVTLGASTEAFNRADWMESRGFFFM